MNRRSFLSLGGAAALAVSTAAALATNAHAEGLAERPIGAAYTMTNAAAGGNEVVIFGRDAGGALTKVGSAPTGGLGSDGGLDPLASQGSLVLTPDERWLLAVNAGSDDISVFRVTDQGLELASRFSSGGDFPTSLAVFQDLVYVLNAGEAPSISGFRLNHKGHLAPIDGSTRTLPEGGYSQIGFDRRGEVLIVTGRTSNILVAFPVGDDGRPAASGVASPSSGAAPFAFIASDQNRLLVSEAGSNAVSTYEIGRDGSLSVISASVANGQAATCWIVDAGGRFTYTANPGASSLSSFLQQPGTGEIVLVAGAAGTGQRPLDMAATASGRFLYALDPAAGGIDAFQVEADGSLVSLGAVAAGLPLFAQGLAVR